MRIKKNFLLTSVFIIFFPLCLYGILSSENNFSNLKKNIISQEDIEQPNIRQLIDDLHRILKQNPDKEEGWILLGRLCFSDAQYDCAVQSFSKAYQLNPQSKNIMLLYAQALYEQNGKRMDGRIQELLDKSGVD